MMTKGPWKVKYEFNVEDDKGRIVASTGGYSNNTDIEGTHNENCSNAQAISAVPDMIEALKMTLSTYGQTCIESFTDRVTDVEMVNMVKTIDAIKCALEKAGVK